MPKSKLDESMKALRKPTEAIANEASVSDPVLNVAADGAGGEVGQGWAVPTAKPDLKFGEGLDASAVHAARWHALISCMAVGPELHRLLKRIIASHRAETRPADEMPDEPLARLEFIRGRLDTLNHRYGEVLGCFLLWTTDLRAKMSAVQAQLDGVSLVAAVDGAFNTLNRLYRRRNRQAAEPAGLSKPSESGASSRPRMPRETPLRPLSLARGRPGSARLLAQRAS